jgi:hypothetical protein
LLSLKNLYRNFLKGVKEDLIAQIDSQNRKASGLLRSSLRVVANQRLEGELRGLFYIEYLMDGVGSKPSGISPQFVKRIEQWMRYKGIQPRERGRFARKSNTAYRRSAYAIAKKIHEQGTAIYRGQRGLDIEQAISDNIDTFGQEVAREYEVVFEEQFKLKSK